MKKANLLIGIALLLAAALGVKTLYEKLPDSGNLAEIYLPKVVSNEMLRERDSILQRQVPVQVLKISIDSISDWKDVVCLPDSLFENDNNCCNFFRDSRDVVWLRFAITNKSDSVKFLIEVINPFINNIEYHAIRIIKKQKQETNYYTGTDTSFTSRPDTNFRNFLFPVQILKDSTSWFYLRLESKTRPHFRILIFEETERKKHQQWRIDILMTIFYVFTALFLILLAIVNVVSKQRFYWYYFAYVLVTALFIPAHLGLGFMYIWKNNGDLQHIVPMALNNLRLVFGIQFFRLFFDLNKSAPRLNRIIDFSIWFFLFILSLQLVRLLPPDPNFSSLVFSLFLGFHALFSLMMLAWLIHEMLFKHRQRFSWVLPVVALNFIGVGITSLQHLGYGPTGIDMSDLILAFFGIANTFFLSPFVIGAFFLEMVLVFNFAVRRYIRLIEINQKNQIRIARDKEERLHALILATENERKRIARDLHDGACVNLAAINMKVDALKEDLGNSPVLAQKVANIADDLDATYHEVRGISHDLMSKTLHATGLETALEELAGRVQQVQKGLTVDFYSNYPLDRIGGWAKIHLYRIAQELLLNVLKHAGAETVNLQLLEDEGKLLLTVEDDGRGFDPGKALANGGIGLANVRTRVEVLHGKMHLESAPEKGTFISIEIPRASFSETTNSAMTPLTQ